MSYAFEIHREAKATAGVEFLVGVETEFILLKSTSPIEAVNSHGWSNSPKLPSGAVETQVLQEIAQCLQASGVELQMYHAEAAPGQVCSQYCQTIYNKGMTIRTVRSNHWSTTSFTSSGCLDSYSRDYCKCCKQVRATRDSCPTCIPK